MSGFFTRLGTTSISAVRIFNPPIMGLGAGDNSVLQAGLEMAGDYWRNRFLPRHFTADAHGRYGYQQRTPKYLARKAKLGKARVVPLFLSGAMRAALFENQPEWEHTQGGMGDVRATMHMGGLPDYTTMGARRGPDKPKEITTVTDEEVNEMAKALAKGMTEAR